jgi:hypothetical protein
MDIGLFGHRLVLVRGFGAHCSTVFLCSDIGWRPSIVAVLFVGIYHDAEIRYAVAILAELRSHVMDMEERGHTEVQKKKCPADNQP